MEIDDLDREVRDLARLGNAERCVRLWRDWHMVAVVLFRSAMHSACTHIREGHLLPELRDRSSVPHDLDDNLWALALGDALVQLAKTTRDRVD